MHSNDATNSVNENLQAILAGIGFLPLMSVGLFLLGAFIGEVVLIEAPPPPQWFLAPAAFFPLCIGLYLRANACQKSGVSWLDMWNTAPRKQVFGQQLELSLSVTIEEHWAKTHLPNNSTATKNPLKQILNNVEVWGWATFITLLPLAYICIWYGMMVSRQG